MMIVKAWTPKGLTMYKLSQFSEAGHQPWMQLCDCITQIHPRQSQALSIYQLWSSQGSPKNRMWVAHKILLALKTQHLTELCFLDALLHQLVHQHLEDIPLFFNFGVAMWLEKIEVGCDRGFDGFLVAHVHTCCWRHLSDVTTVRWSSKRNQGVFSLCATLTCHSFVKVTSSPLVHLTSHFRSCR